MSSQLTPALGELEAVILAAGGGSRMMPLSQYYPKPMLPVGNLSLIEHQLAWLKNLQITKCTIVIGHQALSIEKSLGCGEKYGIEIAYVFQTERLGLAHAVACVSKLINKSFILLLGDIFYGYIDHEKLYSDFRLKSANAIVGSSYEAKDEILRKSFSIEHNQNGLISRVIEKPRKVLSNIRGSGLYLFDENIFDAINRTPRTALRNEYELTDSIQILIDSGCSVYNSLCVDGDVNVSTPDDLFRLNMQRMSFENVSIVHGENVVMGRSIKLDKVVLGGNTVIGNESQLRNCIVLPGTTVKEGAVLCNSIVYGNQTIKMEL